MRIGVDLRPLQRPLTGIGNYAYHLLEALVHGPNTPDILGFGQLGWTAVDRAYFESTAQHTGTGSVLQAASRSTIVQASPVHAAYNLVRRWAFELGIARHKLSLFHAFAYVPPGPTSTPTIPVVYDLSIVRYPELHPSSRVQSLDGLGGLLSSAPLIHTISRFSAQEIVDVFGCDPSRIAVIYPGVRSIFLQAPTQSQSILTSYRLRRREYFLVVSTLEPRKNLRTVVSAYLQLPPSLRAHFPLCIVGAEGWKSLDLPTGTSDLQTEGSLRFLGFVPDAHLRTLYADTRAMLYPSIYEGFGMPIIEALACGAPVVCSNAASMPEAGGSVARTVPALDVEAWTEEIRRAIDETTIDQDDLRRAHARQFSWQTAAALTLKLYERI